MRRESTRILLARIASELAAKWDRAARGPVIGPEISVEEIADADAHPCDQEMTTLEDMLRAAGKRVRVRTDG
jgi:hypothetical protein